MSNSGFAQNRGRGQHPVSGTRKRVVIINDDDVLTGIVLELLTDEGYEALACTRAAEAHAFVRRHQPNLILLDVHLNVEQNGWHILDVLGLDPVTRPVPVIVWSAASESLTAHAPVLLPKYGLYALPNPFDLDTLLDLISQALTAPLDSHDGAGPRNIPAASRTGYEWLGKL